MQRAGLSSRDVKRVELRGERAYTYLMIEQLRLLRIIYYIVRSSVGAADLRPDNWEEMLSCARMIEIKYCVMGEQ